VRSYGERKKRHVPAGTFMGTNGVFQDNKRHRAKTQRITIFFLRALCGFARELLPCGNMPNRYSERGNLNKTPRCKQAGYLPFNRSHLFQIGLFATDRRNTKGMIRCFYQSAAISPLTNFKCTANSEVFRPWLRNKSAV
jgi:hypothetical protein